MRKGERVTIYAPQSAWHGETGTVTGRPMRSFYMMSPNNRGKVEVRLDYGRGDRTAWFLSSELVPVSAIDLLGELARG